MNLRYCYDPAGRLVQEGNKTYAYGYQDKILSVKENGKVAATFDYYLNGQLASVTRGGETETFYWDGLALVARGQTRYLNEPHAGGGAPVLASGKTLFNDLLGNTIGVQEGAAYTPVKMTAFGETKTKEAFFTGKPFIGELGYAFLLRNYRPNQGKWQTADPLGYPDGWNNFAYCNGRITDCVDLFGGLIIRCVDTSNNYSEVFSSSGLVSRRPNRVDILGSFFYDDALFGRNTETNEVVISIPVTLYILGGIRTSSEFTPGEVVTYFPHESDGSSGALTGGGMYEAVLAHEYAHANVFLFSVMGKVRESLASFDFGGYTSDQILGTVMQEIYRWDSYYKSTSCAAANTATGLAFDDTWMYMGVGRDGSLGWKKKGE